MKHVVVSLIIFCVTLQAAPGSSYDIQPDLMDILRTSRVEFTGRALNINCNKTSGVKFTTYFSSGIIHADGAYDSVRLFGRFNSAGSYITREDGECVCIQFEGTFLLGGDGSGFPPGTVTGYTMNIIFTRTGAKGIYRIGRIDKFVEWEQYGTLDLVWQISHEEPAE